MCNEATVDNSRKVVVLCGSRRLFELICSMSFWKPNEVVHATKIQSIAGMDPERVIFAYGHEYWLLPDDLMKLVHRMNNEGAWSISVKT